MSFKTFSSLKKDLIRLVFLKNDLKYATKN